MKSYNSMKFNVGDYLYYKGYNKSIDRRLKISQIIDDNLYFEGNSKPYSIKHIEVFYDIDLHLTRKMKISKLLNDENI